MSSKRLKELAHRWVWVPLLNQLKRGVTPQKLALTIALGATLGLFPILGATTGICLVIGALLKLNQPVIQIVNHSLYPLQLITIPFFIRAGERIMGAPQIPFSIPQLKELFMENPLGFIRQFWLAGVHGIIAWSIVAPAVCVALYFIFLPVLKHLPETEAS